MACMIGNTRAVPPSKGQAISRIRGMKCGGSGLEIATGVRAVTSVVARVRLMGAALARVSVNGHIDALRWSPVAASDGDRQLAVVAGPDFGDARQVHILARGRVVQTIAAPLGRQVYSMHAGLLLAGNPLQATVGRQRRSHRSDERRGGCCTDLEDFSRRATRQPS